MTQHLGTAAAAQSFLTSNAEITDLAVASVLTPSAAPVVVSSSPVSSSGNNDLPGWAIAVIIITSLFMFIFGIMLYYMFSLERQGKPLFVSANPAVHVRPPQAYPASTTTKGVESAV